MKLKPEEIIAVGFSLVIIPIQLYYNPINASISAVIALVLLIAVIVLNNKYSNKFFKFLSSYYHIPYYGIIFTSFQSFAHKLNPKDYDSLLLNADLSVFGFDITKWFEAYVSKGLTEVLTLSYFSYYILPTLTFTILFFSKGNESFDTVRKYLLSIVIGWYTAFIFYIILPAAGPDMAFPEHYNITLAGLSPVTNTYLQNLSHYLKESSVRNTFPSMHFGIILITNYFTFIYKRKYFWFCTLPLGSMLGIATLYLRQHYLIDLVGSVFMAGFSVFVAIKIFAKTSALK